MRLDAVHIRPVHTIQIADADRKVRHRNIEREIVPHRKLIMERTEPHDPIRTALRQEIIGFALMHREEHAGKGYLRLITERERKILDLEIIDRHSRQVQVEVRLTGNRVVAVTRVIDKTARETCRSTGQDLQSGQQLREAVMIAKAVVYETGIFVCRLRPVAGRTELHVNQLLP